MENKTDYTHFGVQRTTGSALLALRLLTVGVTRV